MTTTSELYWTIARGTDANGKPILTIRQLEALELYDHDLPYTLIALHLGISRERAKQLVTRAGQKIDLELQRRAAA